MSAAIRSMSAAIRRVDVGAVARQERVALLRFARRLSCSAEDAEDACQRAFEILTRHQGRIEPEWGAPWLRTVVRHEAIAIGCSRRRQVPVSEDVLDRIDPAEGANVVDLCERLDERRRAARDLPRLKPDERRCSACWAAALLQGDLCDHRVDLHEEQPMPGSRYRLSSKATATPASRFT